MENLNAEQVKKSLEYWVEKYQSKYYTNHAKEALALINSQEQRIKKLTEENERLREVNAGFALAHLFDTSPNGDCWNDVIEKAKADTVRQMQEEIKKTLSVLCKGDVSEIHRMIDQIAKEMLEGE